MFVSLLLLLLLIKDDVFKIDWKSNGGEPFSSDDTLLQTDSCPSKDTVRDRKLCSLPIELPKEMIEALSSNSDVNDDNWWLIWFGDNDGDDDDPLIIVSSIIIMVVWSSSRWWLFSTLRLSSILLLSWRLTDDNDDGGVMLIRLSSCTFEWLIVLLFDEDTVESFEGDGS